MWCATVLTIFPEMFPGPLGTSLAGKALASGLWALDTVDIRAYATDKHRTVDDTPAGGGPGMVMKADVLARAIDAVGAGNRPRLLMSPRGAPLTQARVADLAQGRWRGDPVRPFRGGRSAADRGAAARGSLGRRLRALRWRDRGDGADRRLRPAYPRGDGQGRIRNRRELRRRTAGISPVHPSEHVRGSAYSGGADRRRPRQGRGLAARRGGTADPRAPSRPLGGVSSRPPENPNRPRVPRGDKPAALA